MIVTTMVKLHHPSYGIGLKQQLDLERKIKVLELELLAYKAEGALRFSNQKYYEKGNKASRLLAFQLRKEQANHVVSKVSHTTSRKLVSQPRDLAEAFASFFKELYDSPEIIEKERKIRKFFYYYWAAQLRTLIGWITNDVGTG